MARDERERQDEEHQANVGSTQGDIEQVGDRTDTGGGANVGGSVHTAGGDFVGRDKIVYGLTAAEVTALVIDLKQAEPPAVWNGRIPYLGLQAFHEADAEFFFGRESLVDELLARLRQGARVIVLAGPSGSGKSSVARAGLFHALSQGRLERSESWLLADMQPAGEPVERLARALARATKSSALADEIRARALSNPTLLPEQMEMYLDSDPRQRFVLLVDQFEEIFTQTKDPAVQAAFIKLLTAAAGTDDGRIVIILSLRSDFVSHCARFPELRTMLSKQFQLVGAMEPAGLAKAITLPALKVGADIDADLVNRIMADMKGEPGALPLMSFALRDLFEAEAEGVGKPMDLTLPEYLDRGGIESALERHADQVFAGFSEEQQALARNVFSRLVEIGQGRVDTRRTATLTELVPAGVGEAQVTAVVRALAREGVRLLTTDVAEAPVAEDNGEESEKRAGAEAAQATVTIAHEKLIDAWPWLRRLVDENRELIALQNEIRRDARTWEEAGKDEGFLYPPGRLLQVEEQLQALQPDLDQRSQEFVDAAVAQRQRRVEEEEARRRRELKLQQDRAQAAEAQRRAEAERAAEAALRAEEAEEAAGQLRRRRNLALGLAGGALLAAIVAFLFFGQARSEQARADGNAATATRNLAAAVAAQATSVINERRAQDNLATATVALGQAEVERLRADGNAATAEANLALATTREHEANLAAAQAQARQFAAQSAAALGRNDWQESLTRAIRAVDVYSTTNGRPDVAARIALEQALEGPAEPFVSARFEGHTGGIRLAVFSPDGSRLLTTSGDARLWEVETGRELAVYQEHKNGVWPAVFSPDGSRLLTASDDSTVRLSDAETGRALALFEGHNGQVSSARFSPDGLQVLTASSDGNARLWEAETGRELVVFEGHTSSVQSAVFSADGTRVLTASSDGSARLWEAETGRELAILEGHTESLHTAVFSPDGTRVLTVSSGEPDRLWEAETGRELAVLEGAASNAFSPDGSRMVTQGFNTAGLWDGKTGREVAVLDNRSGRPVFSPNGALVATGDGERALLWEAETGRLVAELEGQDWVGQAVFSPDGSRILTPDTKTARLWEVETGRQLAVLEGHTSNVFAVAFSPDGARAVTASADGSAWLWELGTGREVASLDGHTERVRVALFSPDGERLLTTGDTTARLWEAETGDELAVLRGHTNEPFSAAFSPDGARALTGGFDATARLWEVETGRELAVLESTGTVGFVGFSPDGERLLTGSGDSTLHLWAAETGRELDGFEGHTSVVRSAVFSPDRTQVLTASSDNTARLWEAETGRPLSVFEGHSDWVWSAVFSPDGARVLTASNDNTARLWAVETGRQLVIFEGHTASVESAVFSPDGRRVLTASRDNTARLWEAETGREIAVLEGHNGWVWSAVYSPDGARLLTASDDRTARLWEAETGRMLAVLQGHAGGVNSAVFSPDGSRILTASNDRTARLWRNFGDVPSMREEAVQYLLPLLTQSECIALGFMEDALCADRPVANDPDL